MWFLSQRRGLLDQGQPVLARVNSNSLQVPLHAQHQSLLSLQRMCICTFNLLLARHKITDSANQSLVAN